MSGVVLYHHRGNLDELLKLDRWWRQTRCEAALVVRLDEDDKYLDEVLTHAKSKAFLPHWDFMIGKREDDAVMLSHEVYACLGLEMAKDLCLVTSDPRSVALFLLTYSSQFDGTYDEA